MSSRSPASFVRAGPRTASLALLALVAACESSEPRAAVDHAASAALRLAIPANDSTAPFANVADLFVDAEDRLWVLDQGAKEIRRFDPSGRLLDVIGRAGGGPGEFSNPIALVPAPDGTLWVVDAGAMRYHVLDTSGRHLVSHPRRVGGFSIPWRGGFLGDGRLVDVTSTRTPSGAFRAMLVVHRLTDGALFVVDSLALPPVERPTPTFEAATSAGRVAAPVPFAPASHWTLDPTGGVWFGASDTPILRRIDLDGITTDSLTLPLTARPVPRDDRRRAIEELRWFTDAGGVIDEGRIPTQRPLFEELVSSSDGALLVLAPDAWLVVDPDERSPRAAHAPLDRFPRPRSTATRLVGVSRDSLGLPTVRVYAWPP